MPASQGLSTGQAPAGSGRSDRPAARRACSARRRGRASPARRRAGRRGCGWRSRWSRVEMPSGIGVPAIFPSNGAAPRRPLPSTGSLGSVPRLPRYYWTLRLPASLPPEFGMPSPGGTAVVLVGSLPRRRARSPRAWALMFRCPYRIFAAERFRVSQVPVGPSCKHAVLSDLGGVATSGHCDAANFAFRLHLGRRPPR